MTYLIAKVIVWLALAFILGALLGWWLRRFKANEAEAVYQAERQALTDENSTLTQSNANLQEDLDGKNQALIAAEAMLGEKEQALLAQTNELLKTQRLLSEAQLKIAEQEAETTQLAGKLELQRNSLAELQANYDTNVAEYQRATDEWLLERATLTDRLAISDKDLAALTSASSQQQQGLIARLDQQEQELTAQLDQQLKERHAERDGLQLRLEQAQTDADQRMKKLQAKVDGMQQQHAKLQQQHSDHLALVQSLEKSNGQLETKVANLLGEMQNEKQVSQQQGNEMQAQLAQLQEALSQANQVAEERQLELDANNESLSSNESQVQRLTQDVRRWRQRIPDLQGELDEKDALLRERDARLATLEEQLHNRATRLQSSQQALIASKSNGLSQQQLNARIARLTAEVTGLAQNNRRQHRALASQQNQLSAQQKDAKIAQLMAQLTLTRKALTEAVSDQAAAVSANQQPQVFLSSRPADVDDLQKIKGIGPKLEGLLHELGIYQFRQIAALQRSDVDWLDDHLNFKGRIDRDQWIAQAQQLATKP